MRSTAGDLKVDRIVEGCDKAGDLSVCVAGRGDGIYQDDEKVVPELPDA